MRRARGVSREHMPRPNVLLVCADHWPARLLGCAGHPDILTPTLDQLAGNGIRFTRAYSTTPIRSQRAAI